MAAATSEHLVRVFRALGDPTRLAIFQAVRRATAACDGCSPDEVQNGISQIASSFDLSLSTVSHHIRELRMAGLLRCERHGQTIRCSIDPEVLAEVARFLDGS
jgi:DNA-binding transcriptional ArsR family regulator